MAFGESKVMTAKEVAAFLKIHPSTLYRLVGLGKIPCFRIFSEWRFDREQLDKWRLSEDRRKQ